MCLRKKVLVLLVLPVANLVIPSYSRLLKRPVTRVNTYFVFRIAILPTDKKDSIEARV
jgi:hypothetical protein